MSSAAGAGFRGSLPHWAMRVIIMVLLMWPYLAHCGEFRWSGRDTNHTSITFDLAVKYENGESVPKDQGRAWQLYCQAARDGDARAFLSLAWLFMNGRGVPRDDQAAAYWLRRAAGRQVPQATNLLRFLVGVEPVNRGCAGQPRSGTVPAGTGARKPPVAPGQIGQEIEEAAKNAGLDAKLVRSVASVESAFDPLAVSAKGAVGVMQLMPATAQRFQVTDRFDSRANIRGGTAYLRELLSRFGGNLDLALAAFNAGEGAVAAHRGIPPFPETEKFVQLVKERCRCFGLTASGRTPRAGD